MQAIARAGVCLAVLAATLAGRAIAFPTNNFVNWESPHVSPMAMTPDQSKLLAVNTADAKLEVFSLANGTPAKLFSVPVGLDPVSVRCCSNTEAWVVNHVSDSVSVVDLTTRAVTATLRAVDPAFSAGPTSRWLDEPWDVVFAGTPEKAYVTFGQSKYVAVWTTSNLLAAPTLIPIAGEQPRALAVSPDGSKVFVAIFESGNKSTILGGGTTGATGSMNISFPPNVVSLASGPYAGVNPPPNAGALFSPAVAVANPPKVSLIVKKNSSNQWMDDNAHNWTTMLTGQSGRTAGWDLADNDVAVITTATNAVSYYHGLMNICMALGVNPATGDVTVVGTDAMNEVRFEPNVKGKFTKVEFATVNDATPLNPTITDLNQHLPVDGVTGRYVVAQLPQSERDKSIGDPRGVVFSSDGLTAYVTGMGSNNVIVTSATGTRTPADNVINVGEGPTGLVLDEARGQLFVMNKFAGTISTIDTATRSVRATTPFFDPTPTAIKVGRKHLYNTHKSSGLGQISCGSCHVDAGNDRLAWDLGDPAGAATVVSTTNRNLGQGLFGLEPGTTNTPFQNYHPMKGPMTTQTLHAIIGLEPFHWRGDKLGLEEFNGAFISLQGDDVMLTVQEMQEFEDFLATITLPPNPYRNFDNTLPTALPLPGHYAVGRSGAGFLPAGTQLPNGNAVNGLAACRSQTTRLDMGGFACVTCHTLPTGAGTDMKQPGPTTFNYQPIAAGPNGERHLSLVSVDGTSNVSTKIPQLRTDYRKFGFNALRQSNTAGFGVLHDGSVDSIERFVSEPVFTVTSDQMVADLVAFILALSGSDLPQGTANSPLEPPGPPSKDTPASVGVQTTAGATVDTTLITSMIALADAGKVGVIAKGNVGGVQRGYKYNGSGIWKSDKSAEALLTTTALTALASAATPITITVVPLGLQTRLGIDRDEDGWLDADELSVCTDAADPAIHPGTPQSVDVDGDLAITVQDIFAFLNAWFAGPADFNRDGTTTVQDIFDFLNAWFAGC